MLLALRSKGNHRGGYRNRDGAGAGGGGTPPRPVDGDEAELVLGNGVWWFRGVAGVRA